MSAAGSGSGARPGPRHVGRGFVGPLYKRQSRPAARSWLRGCSYRRRC